jgi:hypothetical protein
MKRLAALDGNDFRRAAVMCLERTPGISTRVLFGELKKQFRWLTDCQLRTFQRRIKSFSLNPLGALRNSEEVRVVIGVREANWDRRRDLHEGFDVETAAELGGLMPAERRGALAWSRIAGDDDKLFQEMVVGEQTSFLAVGSPVSNRFSAFLMPEIFEIDEGRPSQCDWPFWFCWPHRKQKDSFELLPRELPKNRDWSLADYSFRKKVPNAQAAMKLGAYVFGWNAQMYYIEQHGAPGEVSQDFGVIVARRTQNNSLLACLLGGSGPGTLAAARVLMSGEIDLAVPAFRDRKVLCAPVIAMISWEADSSRADPRTCTHARLLAKPHYLPCY